MNHHSANKRFWASPQLALWFLLASGVYVVLLSPAVFMIMRLSDWVKILIYLSPWIMLWPAYSWGVVNNRACRWEILLIGAILVLGTVNVIFSDNVHNSYEAMKFFLVSGVMSLWTYMFLLADKDRRRLFDWFCCGCLAVYAIIDSNTYLFSGAPFLIAGTPILDLRNSFTFHSTPVGTLVILLAAGPLSLLGAKSSKERLVGWLVLALGVFLILLTNKRGTFLAVAAMGLVWLAYRLPRWGYLLAAAFLAVVLVFTYRGLTASKSLPPDHPSRVSKLHRLELYSYARHVFVQHPLMGIGLRPQTHEKYLADYQLHHPEATNFASRVKSLQTFDNLLVTALVELGTLMTLVYLGLILLIIGKFWRQVRPFQESRGRDFIRLLPLIGLAVHSLIYDTLLFPQINWLFNVQLGLLAGYSISEP